MNLIPHLQVPLQPHQTIITCNLQHCFLCSLYFKLECN